MRLKVCGMTRLDQIMQLDEWGVQFAGLIFYPKSPRYIKKFHLSAIDLKREKMNINRVGVFVNESLDEILRTVDSWRLHMVQLHGDETPKFCEQVSNHVNTIKAFRVGEGDNVEWKIYPYHEFTDMYLFDNGWAGNASQDKAAVYGGSGVHFDWSVIDKVSINKPYFLSGGISPSDAAKLKEFAGAHKDMFAADVNSRFEVAPGDKDMVKIKSFLDELNS
jgi:phosphoribosylanthranilate isomerase